MIKIGRKIFIVISFVFISLMSFSLSDVNANAELEVLYINGRAVTHLNNGQNVMIPKTYQEDVFEMRGAWVSTVWNGDVKKQVGTTEAGINGFKQQFISILDRLEKYDMNTIFFQIRPCNDAFYPSEYNDWSKFLVGAGVDPGWDPLEWMIERTHERGMYFQGWMNAFRITETEVTPNTGVNASHYSNDELVGFKNDALSGLATKNFAKAHPEYVLMGERDKKLILNPGEPEVQQHIINTIQEIIENYDIDGVHFDDYFYLNAGGSNYQTTNLNFAGGTNYNSNYTGNKTLNDLGTYKRYNENPSAFNLPSGLTLGEFRRQSINNMMASIRALVDEHNAQNDTSVEYGSKPAAVWQSDNGSCPDNPRAVAGGSNTSCGAYSSNYDLFADSRAWVENGYVDWVAPQVYFDFASREVPYADIVDWWAGVVEKTNEKRALLGQKPIKMYVAHGIYKLPSNEYVGQFTDENEVVYQMKYNKKHDVIKGSAVYAYSDLYDYSSGSTHQRAMANFYNLWNNNRALPIPVGIDTSANKIIDDYKVYSYDAINGFEIRFNKLEDVTRYVLYRVIKGETLNTSDTNHRLTIVKSFHSEGDMMKINIGNYDETYDYYLQPVTSNNYPSNNITKIEVENVTSNNGPTAPSIEIITDNNEILYGSTMTIIVSKVIDPDGDSLTYHFSASSKGIEGPFNHDLRNVIEEEERFVISFNAAIKTDTFVACVEVTDGQNTVKALSNEVKIVEEGGGNKTNPPSTCQMGTISALMWLSLAGVLIVRKRNS